MHVFTSDSFTGNIITCDEGELVWIKKNDIYSLPIWEGDKIFLKMIEDPDTPFFSLRLEYSGNTLISAELNGKTIDYKEYL